MNKYPLFYLVAVLGAVITLTGCATMQTSLGKDYSKEITSNPQTYFSQVRTATDDNELIVSGRLLLKSSRGVNVPDFVEIALFDEEGKVIESQKVAYYPRMLTGGTRHREARFAARFPEIPPQGTVLRLSIVN